MSTTCVLAVLLDLAELERAGEEAVVAEQLVETLRRERQERREERLQRVHGAERDIEDRRRRGRGRSSTSAQGASSLRYLFASRASCSASLERGLEARASISVADRRRSRARPRRAAPRPRSVSSPGSGTSPKLRWAFVSVRLTRFPQVATSSSLLRRTNSAQVKSVSCVSGPAAVRKKRSASGVVAARGSRARR